MLTHEVVNFLPWLQRTKAVGGKHSVVQPTDVPLLLNFLWLGNLVSPHHLALFGGGCRDLSFAAILVNLLAVELALLRREQSLPLELIDCYLPKYIISTFYED